MLAIKTGASVASAALIVIGLILWHTSRLETRLEAVRGDLSEAHAENRALNSAIATSNAIVAEMEATTQVLRERGRIAQEKAQGVIQEHQNTIARIRREQQGACEPEPLRRRLLNELTPEA